MLQSRMRRWLYLGFLLAFLFIAPAVVLYTAGYRVHFSSRTLVQTGLISVRSIPKGAHIFIDGKDTGTRSTTLVENIFPGDHRVRLKKDGYISWEKLLPVGSRETTFIEDIVLFAEGEAELVREVDDLVAVDPTRGRAAFEVSEGSWSEIWMIETNTGRQNLLARYTSQIPVRRLAWSTDGSFLEVTTGSNAYRQVSLVQTATGRVFDATARAPDLEASWWDTRSGSIYFIRRKGGLLAWNLDNDEVTIFPVYTSSARSDNRQMIITTPVAEQVALSRFDPTTNVSSIIAYLPRASYAFEASPAGLTLLYDKRTERLLVIDERGGEDPILLSPNANLWQWDPSGRRRLLYSDGFDLHILDADTGSDETITRVSSPLTGLAWHRSGNAALVSQAQGISAIEFDGRDRRNVVDLASGAHMAHLWTNDQSRVLYFFGVINNVSGLYSRVLLK